MVGERDMQAAPLEPIVIILAGNEYKRDWREGKGDCLEEEASEWVLRKTGVVQSGTCWGSVVGEIIELAAVCPKFLRLERR